MNQLPANTPIEDTYSAALLPFSNDMVVGVFDGHGGPACSSMLAYRLFSYIAAETLPKVLLEQYIHSLEEAEQPHDLVSPLHELMSLANPQMDNAHGSFADIVSKGSLETYIKDLNQGNGFDGDVKKALINSFLRLDKDIAEEPERNNWLIDSLLAAFSGSTACVAYLEVIFS